MNRHRGFTLIELIVLVVVLVLLVLLLVVGFKRARLRLARTQSLHCLRQIGLAMIQYAGDYGDAFMPLVDARGNRVPAVAADGSVSKEPARSGFAILLKMRYLTTPTVFVHPMTDDRVPADFPTDYKNAPLHKLILKEDECSFGWDPTKTHRADATCAIVADKPSKDVSKANEGTARNNSDNHQKRGQGVFYNDGHVKWGTTSAPDSGDDPDIYTGGPGYEKSFTDAKIIR